MKSEGGQKKALIKKQHLSTHIPAFFFFFSVDETITLWPKADIQSYTVSGWTCDMKEMGFCFLFCFV